MEEFIVVLSCGESAVPKTKIVYATTTNHKTNSARRSLGRVLSEVSLVIGFVIMLPLNVFIIITKKIPTMNFHCITINSGRLFEADAIHASLREMCEKVARMGDGL